MKKTPEINSALVHELQAIEDPKDLIAEIFRSFEDRAAVVTSGQLTGVTIIDLAIQAGIKPRVATIDTLKLFDETYALFDQIEKKYSIKIERFCPDPDKLQAMVQEHGEYLFFDSKEKQELCCRLRKVEPNQRILDTLDVWLTGLRSDQSKMRANALRFEVITHGPDKRPILKVAPLIDWSEEKLRTYCQEHHVPIHPLLDWQQDGWYYESLGCKICTTPIGPHEARRSGRWRWFNSSDTSKECGLHTYHKDDA